MQRVNNCSIDSIHLSSALQWTVDQSTPGGSGKQRILSFTKFFGFNVGSIGLFFVPPSYAFQSPSRTIPFAVHETVIHLHDPRRAFGELKLESFSACRFVCTWWARCHSVKVTGATPGHGSYSRDAGSLMISATFWIPIYFPATPSLFLLDNQASETHQPSRTLSWDNLLITARG